MTDTLKAILIDDEAHCLNALRIKIKEHCQQVEVIDACQGARVGRESILCHAPDLVFLDIEMPNQNGFELLQSLPRIDFHVIFTTAYDEFAIRAFKYNAIDYLLKPIDPEELNLAVDRAFKLHTNKTEFNAISKLLNTLAPIGTKSGAIALPNLHGLDMVKAADIVHCSSEGNYTRVHMANDRPILLSKTLKETGQLLDGFDFLRVHNSHLINLQHVLKYIKGDGGYVVMSNGDHINVSRTRKEALLNALT